MRASGTLLFLLLAFTLRAQDKLLPVSVSVFNNGTALPGTGYAGIFSKTVHPGITLGTAHFYRQTVKSDLFQTFKLGYFYHRHNQHAIQLYSELGYRYRMPGGFYGEGLLGAGYLHSFADVQQFKWEDGRYIKKTNLGRPQLMISASLAAGYDLQKKTRLPLKLFLQYQFWLQTPFVKKYVPLLPNAALHIGTIYSITRHRAAINPQ
jgi:hypothetical protein